MAEEERRRVAEKERSHIYKEFQGKVTQEIDKLTELHSDKSKLRESLQPDGSGSASTAAGDGGGNGNGNGNGADSAKNKPGGGGNPGADNVDRQMAYLVAQSQTGGSSSSRPQGQAKPVPDCLVGELARFVCQSGSKGIDKIVADFTGVHPEASKRQVEKKIQEIAYKEKRAGDARDSWYIREGFEGLLEEGLGKHYPPGEALQADADAKDRAKARKREGREESGKESDFGKPGGSSSAKKRRPHADGERPGGVTVRSPFYLFKHANREAAFECLQDAGVAEPTPEEVKERVKMMWRELGEKEREEYIAKAEKTGWELVPEPEPHNNSEERGGGKRKASFGGDVAAYSSTMGVASPAPPESPSSAFSIPKRKKW